MVSLALHLLTILYAAYGLSDMAYKMPEEAFGLPDLEQDSVREKASEEERLQNGKWMKSQERKEDGRERREVKQGGRGDVEFVHPDLKKELLKQGEDPANPWVWLTSYSRIPVTLCSSSKLIYSQLRLKRLIIPNNVGCLLCNTWGPCSVSICSFPGKS